MKLILTPHRFRILTAQVKNQVSDPKLDACTDIRLDLEGV